MKIKLITEGGYIDLKDRIGDIFEAYMEERSQNYWIKIGDREYLLYSNEVELLEEVEEKEIKLPSEEGLQKAKDILNERYEEFELPKVIEKEYDRIIAEESSTGALRYNSDKPQLSQIDPLFLIGLAELMTQSAKKYSKWNYAKGQNLTTVCDSMSRHLLSFLNGENDDKESGKSHLLHIACNALIAYSTTERHLEKHPELDDRISSFLGGLDE